MWLEIPFRRNRIRTARVRRRLRTVWLGRDLRCYREVGSTNRVARDAAAGGAPHGTVVIAEAQTHGRGRLDRMWASPPGLNLYLSAVLRPGGRGGNLSSLGIVAGVAVCDALGEWFPGARIKWPNDVLLDGRKAAGILAECGKGKDGGTFVVVGIGVNLNAREADFPPELRGSAVSLRMVTGLEIDRAGFTAALLGHLERCWEKLDREGFLPLRDAWWERSCVSGRDVTVHTPRGVVTGRAVGLDDDGALRLKLASGGESRVIVGDVILAQWEGGWKRTAAPGGNCGGAGLPGMGSEMG